MKLDDFSHEPYDQKKRIVPLPRMGAPVDKNYYRSIERYEHKKEIKQLKAEVEEYNQH
jgi:hypothetical protein